MADLAASARYATLWGRTNYGRAFTRFSEQYADALTPKTNLLVLGDARSNHTDLALPVVKELVHAARHSWWLNPEHTRNWNTGDSAAREYGRLIPWSSAATSPSSASSSTTWPDQTSLARLYSCRHLRKECSGR